MKRIEISYMAALALALPLGCGTEDDDPSEPISAATNELARIDFEDGNSVRFESLDDGVVVWETGLQVNTRHLVPRDGMSALDAFHALAPGREAPPSLMQAHQRLHPDISKGALHLSELPGDGTKKTAPPAGDTSHDPDLEHTGEFQQSLPFDAFKQQACDFPSGSPNYKHSRLFAHTHTVEKAVTAYWAVGSDIGTITYKVCANGRCSNAVALQAGFQTNAFYDPGTSCKTACDSPFWGLFGGCVTICAPRQFTFQAISSAISSNIRFHDCARFTR